MPYITAGEREELDPFLGALVTRIGTVGALNYCITRLCVSQNARVYAEHNAVVGVLECVKAEYLRRALAPYEDQKRIDNGDVY